MSAAGALGLASCTSIVSPDYGVREGHLAPCPANEDCVSTQDSDPKLHIAPMDYVAIDDDVQATRDKAHADLVSAINAVGPARIVSNHRNYIRVEYPAAGHEQRNGAYYYQPDEAVDEVEFYLAPTGHIVEMRSVGKLGLLNNDDTRERLEKIRVLFLKFQQQPPK
ncbi:MAG TPA: DUF1499 domain-containing protein [Gammaproteobacteria bacterium]|nr:DUF1499 domain-containing protein [Gammaproteobacteria bacterium]